MEQIEKNIIASFRLVKEDVLIVHAMIEQMQKELHACREQIASQKETEAYLVQRIALLEKKEKTVKIVQPRTKVVEKVVRIPSKARKKVFVASKTGKSVHDKKCPYAKNIKRSSMVQFKTKNQARKKGYRLCSCL